MALRRLPDVSIAEPTIESGAGPLLAEVSPPNHNVNGRQVPIVCLSRGFPWRHFPFLTGDESWVAFSRKP